MALDGNTHGHTTDAAAVAFPQTAVAASAPTKRGELAELSASERVRIATANLAVWREHGDELMARHWAGVQLRAMLDAQRESETALAKLIVAAEGKTVIS